MTRTQAIVFDMDVVLIDSEVLAGSSSDNTPLTASLVVR